METDTSLSKILSQTLKRFWGFDHFRELQKEIIVSVLQQADTLALLPTGGGKSLCYQLPALVREGVTIVVSPLLALMRDQVYDLINRGISAAYISSEFDDEQIDQIYSNLKNEDYKLLYVSPERLTNRKFIENIAEVQVSFLAVDEAHCISEWGNDFRPSYQNIKGFRQLFPYIPCLALTATASVKVMEEIQKKLDFKSPAVFKKSYKRTNLFIQVRQTSGKYNHILYYLKASRNSGLIYVRTRRQAEDLANWLLKMGIDNVDYYHAGLPVEEKKRKQAYWLQHQVTLVSTNAFGMGIDKDDVGFVIHLSPPPSIENYYQEIGRAGRNGLDADAIILWNESELTQIDGVLSSHLASADEYQKILRCVYSICGVADYEQPEDLFEISVEKIQRLTNLRRQRILEVLRFLHNQEIAFVKESPGKSSLELSVDIRNLELLGNKDAYFVEQLMRSLDGVATHKVYFHEKNLEAKLGVDIQSMKLRFRELEGKGYLRYFDGGYIGIRFLMPRDDKMLQQKYWKIFSSIQKNRIRKWEEMKYYLKEDSFCKMRMILAYFGEHEKGNCGKCSYCLAHQSVKPAKELRNLVFEALMKSPMSLDELAISLKYYHKDEVLDLLKDLLDQGRIKMLNYKTYSL